MIKKYCKKPIVVEAVQWRGDNRDEIIELAKEKCVFVYNPNYFHELYIETFCGRMKVKKGDYVVKDKENGEVYPCEEKTFKEIYEEMQHA